MIKRLADFSFGVNSAIITSLAFIVILSRMINPNLTIIGLLLLFAIADNISDLLGIHIFQESGPKKPKVVMASTLYNFLTRVLIVFSFILIVALLPIDYAVIVSIIYGISLLAILTSFIAKENRVNPYNEVLKYVAIAILIIAVSNFIGMWI